MKIDERVKPILEKVNFIDRYRKLSQQYEDNDYRMEKFSYDQVIEIMSDLGYEVSYDRKENFFKLLENNQGLETQLNINLKYGSVELILGVVKDNERYTVGGPFGMIARLMGESERIKKPVFSNYDQLREVLKDSFQLYEDVKKNLMQNLS